MLDSFYIAAIGMHAHQNQLDAISQNVANLNTSGFRREVVAFSALSATDPLSPLRGASSTDATAGVRGGGVTTSIGFSMTAGALTQTGQPLDVAIDGSGFIEVTRADGSPAYTRAGSLMVNAQGLLSTRTGEVLAGNIAVPPDTQSVSITGDGRVLALPANSANPLDLGRIELVSFANPQGLEASGGTLYVQSAASGEAHSATPGTDGLGLLRVGYLESSNVDMTTELTTLMLAQRGFELNSHVAQAADQMFATTNQLVR